MTTPRLFLIDGSGYLYRAFYAIRNLTRRDGFPTNAIFGFVKMVRKVVEELQPDYLAVVFDTKGPTFRHHLDESYKLTRKPMPDELRQQVPLIREAVAGFNIPLLERPGYEADDLIGTLARLGEARGWEVVIASGDKDLMQLVGPRVAIVDTMKELWIRAPEVEARWGVPPELVTQVMALAGDTSDNIPGVPGIGDKTAAQLIREYGGLEPLLAAAAGIKQPKRRQMLLENADRARLSLQLVTIDCQVPLDGLGLGIPEGGGGKPDLSPLRRREPDWPTLRALFMGLEFTSLVRELDEARLASSTARDDITRAEEQGEAGAAAEAAGSAGQHAQESPHRYRVITTWEEFDALLAALKELPEGFSLDTETTGLDAVTAELVGLSLSWRPRDAVYIPVAHTPQAAPHGQLPREAVLAALKPLLDDPAIPKTGQNLKYEYVLLRKYGIRLNGIRRDAMLLSYMLHGSTRRHNLDAIAVEELGRSVTSFKEVAGVGKKQLRFDQIPLERAAPYACEDAEVAWEAAERLEGQLSRLEEPWRLHQRVEAPLIPVLAEMELAGALIDQAALKAMSKRFTVRREELVAEIHALAGEAFNVNSPQQLGAILFDKLGIKGGKRTKTGYSTDVSVLTKLAEKGHELPARVLDYRSLTKLQSTYTDALLKLVNPATGRVHTSYNQAVTLTGRLSSSDPNLQNIPVRTEEGRAIRTAFIAPPGWKLLSADYSQIELRLLAHIGDVPRLREAFHAGRDVHAATAAELFGVAPEAVDGDQRRMAKTINFGLIYGMSAFGLANRLKIPNDLARRYMERYFERYDGVQEYMLAAIQQARATGYARTIGGRRCPIQELHSGNRNLREFAERTAINAPLQGSAADLIKMAMLRLDTALREGGFRSRMILQVHDELVLEVPEEELETIQPVVREAMEGVMTLSVPLRVDMGIGANWAEAH